MTWHHPMSPRWWRFGYNDRLCPRDDGTILLFSDGSRWRYLGFGWWWQRGSR